MEKHGVRDKYPSRRKASHGRTIAHPAQADDLCQGVLIAMFGGLLFLLAVSGRAFIWLKLVNIAFGLLLGLTGLYLFP